MNYYTLITAFAVSIDSFACGLSLALEKNNKPLLVALVTLTVFCMCLATNYASLFFRDYLNERVANLGGIMLILVGFINLIKKDKTQDTNKGLAQIIVVGFAVGLDGALANLSLALMGINSLLVPTTIAIFHGVMISFSLILSKTKIAKKISNLTFISPAILILLGTYKLICFF